MCVCIYIYIYIHIASSKLEDPLIISIAPNEHAFQQMTSDGRSSTKKCCWCRSGWLNRAVPIDTRSIPFARQSMGIGKKRTSQCQP